MYVDIADKEYLHTFCLHCKCKQRRLRKFAYRRNQEDLLGAHIIVTARVIMPNIADYNSN